MATMTVTHSLDSLRVLFNKIDEVYYKSTKNVTPDSLASVDYELPVLSDGVTFNTGDLDVTKVKLTTGATWTSYSEVQDSDISFQVATVHDGIVALFFENHGGSVTFGSAISGNTYAGKGFGIEPKKCTGGLLLASEDKQTLIFLPNVEMYGSMTYEDGKPIYINVTVTPLGDASGNAFYILKADQAAAAAHDGDGDGDGDGDDGEPDTDLSDGQPQ